MAFRHGTQAQDGEVDHKAFYQTYHGHEPMHLQVAHTALRKNHQGLIFLAGDSSLDNKFWFRDTAPALNGYEDFLRPPLMKKDICYWLNSEAVRCGAAGLACLNTAVEATTLHHREKELRVQDRFITDHITQDDYLIVSVGGNDIALSPSLATMLNMFILVRSSSASCLRRSSFGITPCAGRCGGRVSRRGGTGCARSLLSFVCLPGLAYFVDLFGNAVQNYVLRVLGSTRPKKVVVCMIYFLDEQGHSWADRALALLDYNRNPERLQEAIRAVFRLATKRIRIPGTEVVAFPLFDVLDGKTTSDYVSRVEPSVTGGEKMARALMSVILDN